MLTPGSKQLKILLIFCFTTVGFLLLSLPTATYIKFVMGTQGYSIEQTVYDNLFKINLEYMYAVYFTIFFPAILVIESFFIRMPFSKIQRFLFILQSVLLLNGIILTWFILSFSGFRATEKIFNWCIIIGVEVVYLLISITPLFRKAKPIWKFIFSSKE